MAHSYAGRGSPIQQEMTNIKQKGMQRENYRMIYHNGLSHFKAADSLSKQELFGFAISHLILGSEELIKFLVVQHNSGDEELFADDVKSTGKKSVFRQHAHKHSLLAEFQEAISPEFMAMFEENLKRSIMGNESIEGLEKFHANRFRKIGPFLHTAYQEINIPAAEKDAFYQWLENANELKNRGFYVDRDINRLISPAEINKDDYAIAWKFCSAIIQQVHVMMSIDISDDEFIEMMNEEVEISEEARQRILSQLREDQNHGE